MEAVLKVISARHCQPEPGAAGGGTAPACMVTRIPGRTPLVLDSPHSGTTYPEDFRAALQLPVLRRAEDTHVEKLYGFAPALGVGWVEAHFPRIYLDANRDTTELDDTLLDAPWPHEITADPVVLQKVRLGKGLVWKYTDDGQPIYDRRLTVDEVRARIERCWKPYHAAVAAEIDAAHARHGYSIHLNCHSMPAVAGSHATLHPGLAHADFVVGDRDGSTASAALSQRIVDFLRGRGYSVDHNHPYKGVELVRRYGRPQQDRHSIQLEINRGLYMDEQTLEIRPPGFERLQRDLRELVQLLLRTDPRGV